MTKEFEHFVNTRNVFISALFPLTQSPFVVRDDESMVKLIESISQFGILEPLTVRRIEAGIEKYEVISGYRRLEACKRLGIKNIPVRVLDLSKDNAIIAMIDANLCHREHILPSEKAAAYKMKLETMKRQGYRSDLEENITSAQSERRLESAEKLAQESEDSRAQIRRYIRLNNLIPEILDLVDDGKIAFTPAVELSYLTEEQQKLLLESIEPEDRTPSFSQSVRLKKLSQANQLDDEQIEAIMQEDKANQKEIFKIPMERLQKAVPNIKPNQLEDYVIKACEHYKRYLQKKREVSR